MSNPNSSPQIPVADQTQPATALLYPQHSEKRRTFALLYFVGLLVVWNLFGHTVLGFEQSWAQLLTATGTACAAQVFFDVLHAKITGRPVRLKKDPLGLLTFFAPALISGIALGMLLLPNKLLLPFAFASIVAIASKVVFRAPLGGGKTQHFLNPSNFAIVVTLFLCPWVSIAPPYHFMGHATGAWNWIVPAIILASGIGVHSMATGRLPLVLAWLGGFLTQAFLRHLILGVPLVAPLIPMTSSAFIIFTLYMIPDPATTPFDKRAQIAFGLAVATVYGLIQVSHQVYGLFGALVLVSTSRGIWLYLADVIRKTKTPQTGALSTAV